MSDTSKAPAEGTEEAAADPRLEEGDWRRGLDDATVEAVGALTEALETVEVARGHLYAFHRLTGTGDFQVEKAADLLRKAGHADLAAKVSRELVGRNVLPGRWTFQVVEDYDDTYYTPFRHLEREVRDLTEGVPHVFEADLKRRRRSFGEPGHEPNPHEPAAGAPTEG